MLILGPLVGLIYTVVTWLATTRWDYFAMIFMAWFATGTFVVHREP